MSFRRWIAAAIAMLSVVYLRYTMPVFDECVIPVLREMLTVEQIGRIVPVDAAAWLNSD